MAPRSRFVRHQHCEFRSTQVHRRPIGVALLAILLLSIFSYSQLEARTEPRIESDSTDADSAFGTSRALSGDAQLSVLSSASRGDYINYSKDFPEAMESPLMQVPEHPNVLKYVHYYQGEGRSTFLSALTSTVKFRVAM